MDGLEILYAYLTLRVQGGFDSREDMINSAVEFLLEEYSIEWLEEHAARITDELLAEHLRQQQTWATETDCDRLDDVFAILDRRGIVARQHFTCCQTCGHAEITCEIQKTEQYRPVRGYVFSHWQDTESALIDEHLYLAYGSVDGKEAASIEIGHEIYQLLQSHEFDVEWNGEINKRIKINQITWQRRRLSHLILA